MCSRWQQLGIFQLYFPYIKKLKIVLLYACLRAPSKIKYDQLKPLKLVGPKNDFRLTGAWFCLFYLQDTEHDYSVKQIFLQSINLVTDK